MEAGVPQAAHDAGNVTAAENVNRPALALEKLKSGYDFKGQTAVITGGTGVLGREIACVLADCGANVAILHSNPNSGKELRERLASHAASTEFIVCDVLSADALNLAAATVRARFGKVDILINGAGGNKPQATTNPQQKFFDLPADALRWVLELNLLGTILPSQVFGKGMAEQGSGVILNISSMSGFRPLTRVLTYSAAKAAINNFTQWLAVHLAQEYSPRIRVNAIAPGFFLTEQNRFLLTDRETGELTARGKAIISHTPMARFGEPEDLLGAVLWLISPAAAFVTGVVVPVDGGFSAFSGV
jgi:NAD(P)-dependent dehydrogenase (short-subunit alcohol dehydrogenase family)